MDHQDRSDSQSATNTLHYWAQLEGKSSTMSDDLLRSNGDNETNNSKRQQIAVTCGLAIYLALAIVIAALCLRYCGPLSTDSGTLPRQNFFEPKYLTSVLKPVQR